MFDLSKLRIGNQYSNNPLKFHQYSYTNIFQKEKRNPASQTFPDQQFGHVSDPIVEKHANQFSRTQIYSILRICYKNIVKLRLFRDICVFTGKI